MLLSESALQFSAPQTRIMTWFWSRLTCSLLLSVGVTATFDKLQGLILVPRNVTSNPVHVQNILKATTAKTTLAAA